MSLPFWASERVQLWVDNGWQCVRVQETTEVQKSERGIRCMRAQARACVRVCGVLLRAIRRTGAGRQAAALYGAKGGWVVRVYSLVERSRCWARTNVCVCGLGCWLLRSQGDALRALGRGQGAGVRAA